MDKIKRLPTKVFVQAGLTQRSINSSNSIQLQYCADTALLSIISYLRQQNKNQQQSGHGAIALPATNTPGVGCYLCNPRLQQFYSAFVLGQSTLQLLYFNLASAMAFKFCSYHFLFKHFQFRQTDIALFGRQQAAVILFSNYSSAALNSRQTRSV